MRKFKQLLLLVISITLVGCHTTGSIKQKAWKVQQGMTTEEIGQLLGNPISDVSMVLWNNGNIRAEELQRLANF